MKLTDDDIDAKLDAHFPPSRYSATSCPPRRCSGPCDQGRRECATPEACEREIEDAFGAAKGLVYGIPAGVVLWAIVCALILIGVWERA